MGLPATRTHTPQWSMALTPSDLSLQKAPSGNQGTGRRYYCRITPFVSPVGVFVDEKTDTIKEICDFCGIHTVQLHGNESPLYLNDLKGYKIIKAFRIKEEDDLKPLANYKPHAFCWIVM